MSALQRQPNQRPGWPELAVALILYVVLLICLSVLWLLRIPDEQAAWRGIAGMALNGAIGTVVLIATYSIRLRNLDAFGFRRVGKAWITRGALLGVVAFFLSLAIEHVYFSIVTELNNQADFQAAARDGLGSLVLLVFAGAVLTPFGEEVVFRGVVANALNKYGPWAGIIGSAVIFATVHGPSVIFFNALMVGIITGTLFRATISIWPGFVTHFVYNGIWLLIYAM